MAKKAHAAIIPNADGCFCKRLMFNSNNRTGPENIQKTEMKLEEKILLLKQLLDKGLITQEEYNKKKADLLENF